MSTALRTARRNLAWRIEQFINEIERGNIDPTYGQHINLHDALSALELGTYTVGQDAMMLAERGWAPRKAPVGSPSSMLELIEWHRRLMAEGG